MTAQPETTCRECRQRPASHAGLQLCDPCQRRYHHQHVKTGEIRQCLTDGCNQTWPVLCHAGRRRRCNRHQAAERRKSDRQAKAALRAAQKADQAIAEGMFSRPLREVMEFVTSLDGRLTYRQARQALEDQDEIWRIADELDD